MAARHSTHKSNRAQNANSKELARGKSFGSKSPLQVKSRGMKRAQKRSGRK